MAPPEKRTGHGFGWALAASAVLLLVALLVWQFAGPDWRWGRSDSGAADNGVVVLDTAMFRVLPIETVEYLAECGRDPDLPRGPAGQDDYVRRCLHSLARALEAQARRDTVREQVIRLHLESVHQEVAGVAQTAGSVVHNSGVVRKAMLAQSYLLVQLHRARYLHVEQLSREVAQARRAARAIDAESTLDEQVHSLEEFFHRAGNALYLMEASTAEVAPSGGTREASR